MRIVIETYNFKVVEKTLVEAALHEAGSIVAAAELLHMTRHAVKRRIVKYGIPWTSNHPAHGPKRPEAV